MKQILQNKMEYIAFIGLIFYISSWAAFIVGAINVVYGDIQMVKNSFVFGAVLKFIYAIIYIDDKR